MKIASSVIQLNPKFVFRIVDCSRVTDTILAQRGIGSVIKQSVPDQAVEDEAQEDATNEVGYDLGIYSPPLFEK